MITVNVDEQTLREGVDQYLQDLHSTLWMDWYIDRPKDRVPAIDWIVDFLHQLESR